MRRFELPGTSKAARDWGYLTPVIVFLGYLTPVIVFLGYLNLVVAITNLMPDDASDGRVAWRVVPLLIEKRSAKRAPGKTLRSLAKHK